ncbi:MAG: response regulator [Verrucomicrobiales bacterium]|nr:response regulator [Verrucomicrobiales bacterium]
MNAGQPPSDSSTPKLDPILLVDDDPRFRDCLASALRQRGIEVESVADSAAAVEQLERGNFVSAVVDLRLPESGGLELIPRLLQIQPQLRIVMLTGYASVATAMKAVRLGAHDYLTKPADTDQILHALAADPSAAGAPSTEERLPQVPSLEWVEWQHMHRVLAECHGNISQAARLLRIDRRSLQRKLAKYAPNR